MRIEVFIKKEEVALQSMQLGRPVAGHYCTAHDTFKTEQVLTEESKKVLVEASEKARELSVEVFVYDLSSLKGKLAARRLGVKSPTWRIAESDKERRRH